MNKSLYYIECTANYDVEFDNGWADCEYGRKNNLIKTIYKKGDVVYFNPKTISNETYVGYGKDKDGNYKNPYTYWSSSHLPFTRQKKFAKKWQIKEYADKHARHVNEIGHFTAVVKEIKLTYTEEEI